MICTCPLQALNITTHILKPGGTFVAKVIFNSETQIFAFT